MSESARQDTPEQAEFRQYCREWLQHNKPGEPPVRLPLSPLEIMTREQLAYLRAWQKVGLRCRPDRLRLPGRGRRQRAQ